MFDLQNLGQGHQVQGHQVQGHQVQHSLSTSIKVIARIFTPSLTVSEILRFDKFDLANLGQSHGIQHSQWSRSIVNINLYKSHT